MSKYILYLTIVVTSIGLLFQLIACPTVHWLEQEATIYTTVLGFRVPIAVEIDMGLWKVCTVAKASQYTSYDKCVDLDDFNLDDEHMDKIKVTRAFTILAILASAAALTSLVAIFKYKKLIFVHIVCSAVAVLCLIIGLSVYTDEAKDTLKRDTIKYGYSFVLAWVGFVFAGISTATGLMYYIKTKDQE